MSSTAIVVSFLVIFILFKDSLPFFNQVSVGKFLTGTDWSPLFANPQYGVLPLVAGTFLTSFVAMIFAFPIGLILAVYLNEFVPKIKVFIKPLLELLSSVPTVVFGYFTLLLVTPTLQLFLPNLNMFNMLSAGIVIGFMILPMMISFCDDAFSAVPQTVKEASLALGSTQLQMMFSVVIPFAKSAIVSAVILCLSRALGETMIVAIAAGMQPNFTYSPLETGQTLTSYIVQVAQGDLAHASIGYSSIFAVALVLFFITLAFNLLGNFIKNRSLT
jgi:phosphate transport system permease protein